MACELEGNLPERQKWQLLKLFVQFAQVDFYPTAIADKQGKK